MIPSTCAVSTGDDASRRCASIRSTASRVSASDAGGSGLIMMIQPASGPGRLRAGEVEDLLEALRRDQADAGPLRLEHGVRRNGRAVKDVAELADSDAGLVADAPHAGQNALATGRRASTASSRGTARAALVVHEEEVGERAADVDPQPVRHLVLLFQPATGANVPAR